VTGWFSPGARPQSPVSWLRRRCASVTIALVAVAPTIGAQVTVARVDVGSSRVSYADSLRLTATSVTPVVTVEWPLAIARASVSYSRLSHRGTSFQGVGGFSLFTPAAGAFLAELEGLGGGTRTDGVTTSQVLGIARAHLTRPLAGVWIGAGGGTASNAGLRRPTWLAELGGWATLGATQASLTVAPTTVNGDTQYTDVSLAARTTFPRLELTVTAGTRSGTQPELFGTPVKAWASGTVVSWITRSIAIVAGGGRYPVDLTQGFPGGTYGSVGLRLAARAGAAPTDEPNRTLPEPSVELPTEVAVGGLAIASIGGNRRFLYVRIPEAKTVELAADFTAWQAVPLTRGPDGWWSTELEIEPGAYETGLRVDGGRWIAPPGLTPMRDEFAGEGGILIVP
jgi:hypothetical protein